MSRKNSIAVTAGVSEPVRARFWPDMLLRHDDMEALSAYPRDLSRLLLRSLFGCGVLSGLAVKLDNFGPSLIVEAGVALTDSGDPILVPGGQRVEVKKEDAGKGPLWVVLCGTTKCDSPRAAARHDDDEPTPCTRERQGFEIHVLTSNLKSGGGDRSIPQPKVTDCKCVDPAHPLYEGHYAGLYRPSCEEDPNCVLLAQITRVGDDWKVDHKVRRFVRPVLMRDPVVAEEEAQLASGAKGAGAATPTKQAKDAAPGTKKNGGPHPK